MRNRTRERIVDKVTVILALFMGIYFMAGVLHVFLPPDENMNLHLALALIILFLTRLRRGGKWVVIGLALIVSTLAATAWIHVFADELAERAFIHLNLGDIIFGIIIVILVLEATRQTFGVVLPIIVLLLITYIFLGRYIPGIWGLPPFSLAALVARLSVGFSGIYSFLLGLSVSYIFLFIIFGGVLGVVGGTDFFIEAGKILGRKLKGGSAVVAVTSSALVGMISGSTAANVTITGSFTIPAMKKVGYTPDEAGGIESAASSGGQMMPPVMGAIGFVMAAMIGVPYRVVMIAAFIPAVLYFLSIALTVQRIGQKRNIAPVAELVDLKKLLLSSPTFFIPILVIAALLLMAYTPAYAVFWGLLSLLLIACLRKETRSLRRVLRGFVNGAISGASVAVALACLGVIVLLFGETALALQIGDTVKEVAHGSILVGAALAMIMSLMFGSAAHTLGSYIIVAITAGPVLVSTGLTLLQVHLLCGYFACYGMISPPVGFTSLVAAKLADSNYLKTGWRAMLFSSAGIMVPLMFIWSPALLMNFSAPPLIIAMQVVASLIVIALLSCFVAGYYIRDLSLLQRAVCGVAIGMTYSYLPTQSPLLLFIGVGLVVGLTLWQIFRGRKEHISFEGVI